LLIIVDVVSYNMCLGSKEIRFGQKFTLLEVD